MAQDVIINGVEYDAVPGVQLPRAAGGGNALFLDATSYRTSAAQDVIDGVQNGNLTRYKTLVNGEINGSSPVYVMNIPEESKVARFASIGGKSIVMNQLVQNGNFASISGWSATSASYNFSCADNTITINNTQQWAELRNANRSFVSGHKYYLRVDAKLVSSADMWILGIGNGETIGSGASIIVRNVTSTDFVRYDVIKTFTQDRDQNRVMIKDMKGNGNTAQFRNYIVLDLTQMFGAGNEPTTVEQVKAILPADYYAYNTGSILNADVSAVTSADSENATVATYTIPSAIRNLPCYGAGIGDVYNEVNYVSKKYIQRIASRAYQSGDDNDQTVLTDKTNTIYPLATPVETDISSYLTADNVVAVEDGGTLTFTQADAHLDVPNEVKYGIANHEPKGKITIEAKEYTPSLRTITVDIGGVPTQLTVVVVD